MIIQMNTAHVGNVQASMALFFTLLKTTTEPGKGSRAVLQLNPGKRRKLLCGGKRAKQGKILLGSGKISTKLSLYNQQVKGVRLIDNIDIFLDQSLCPFQPFIELVGVG